VEKKDDGEKGISKAFSSIFPALSFRPVAFHSWLIWGTHKWDFLVAIFLRPKIDFVNAVKVERKIWRICRGKQEKLGMLVWELNWFISEKEQRIIEWKTNLLYILWSKAKAKPPHNPFGGHLDHMAIFLLWLNQ
jgi:hypothetical protein